MTNIAMDSQLLTALMACPRLANFRFNMNLVERDGKNNSFECGSIAHFILEHTNKSIIAGKSRPDAILIGYEAGKEYLVPYKSTNKYMLDETHIGLTNTPEENIKVGNKFIIGYKYVFETMEQYFDHYRNDTFVHIAAEEVRSQIIYQDTDLRILWKAKYDNIIDTTNGLLPRDYKTMKQNRDTLSLNNQFMGQCILTNSRQIMIDKIGFQTSLKPQEKFIRVLIPYSIDRLAEWANEIVPYYARMYLAYNDANYWPPNFTHCENKYGKCAFAGANMPCEADRNIREDSVNLYFGKGRVWDIIND